MSRSRSRRRCTSPSSCPRRLRQPLTILVELLAAVPRSSTGCGASSSSPRCCRPPSAGSTIRSRFLPFVGGAGLVPNYFIGGLILAIMIVPIVTAISREVMATVPPDHKEAALALGATRWEMIRVAVLPYSRAGISGAAMLGLGRAIGETIAVTIVIGNAPRSARTIFTQGYTLAAVIANEFNEAASRPDPPRGADRRRPRAVRPHALVNARRALLRQPGRDGDQRRSRRDGGMTRRVRSRPIVSSRRAADRVARGDPLALTLSRSCRCSHRLLPPSKGLGACSVDFFTTDPTGTLPRRPGRHQAARSSARSRSSPWRARSRSRSASASPSTSSSTASPARSPTSCATSSTS